MKEEEIVTQAAMALESTEGVWTASALLTVGGYTSKK